MSGGFFASVAFIHRCPQHYCLVKDPAQIEITHLLVFDDAPLQSAALAQSRWLRLLPPRWTWPFLLYALLLLWAAAKKKFA